MSVGRVGFRPRLTGDGAGSHSTRVCEASLGRGPVAGRLQLGVTRHCTLHLFSLSYVFTTMALHALVVRSLLGVGQNGRHIVFAEYHNNALVAQ